MQCRHSKQGTGGLTLSLTPIALATLLYCSSVAAAPATPTLTLTGNYIEIGTSGLGTIGSVGSTSPGILYDNTGTGTFNTSYDYLTPGTPFEGFAVKATSSGTTYNATENNSTSSGADFVRTSFTDLSSGTHKAVQWVGSYTPSGGSKLLDISNTVGFDVNDKKVTITTTITAAQNLSNLYFARFTDPDCSAAPGDSSSTNNYRGNGSVPATNLVYAEALASKYVIGLYSAASTGVNTAVTSWSTSASAYYAGTSVGNGDYTIGLAYNTASLNAGDSITYTYYYVFGSDIADAIMASISGVNVTNSTAATGNQAAHGAAAVIDNTPTLQAEFTTAGLTTDQQVSDGASQTLPLLVGGGILATENALLGINHVIQARQEGNLGLSSGDTFAGDKKFWMKPFGSWADQNDRDGVSGFKADTWGIALGADMPINERNRLGVALAYARSSVDSNSVVAPQSSDVDIYQLIGYGSRTLDNGSEINFQIDAGWNDNSGMRQLPSFGSAAASAFNSWSAHAGVGYGKVLTISDKTQVVPSIRADYTWIRDEGYTETGAGVWNLSVDSRSSEQLILGIDGKVIHKLNQHTTLSANLGVGYDTMSENSSITAAYAGAPGASFVTYGIKPDPWSARGGLGLVYQTNSGMEVTARYDVEGRSSGFSNQTASMKLRWSF